MRDQRKGWTCLPRGTALLWPVAAAEIGTARLLMDQGMNRAGIERGADSVTTSHNLMSALGFVRNAGVLAIAVFVAAGCARRTTVPVDPAGLHRAWSLVQMRDSAGDATLVPDSEVSLEFMEDGRVGGRSSINQFGGTVELLSDGSISWSALTSTLMAGPPELMVQERRYLAALEATRRFQLDGDRLTLADSTGRVELQFVPADSGVRR